MSNEINPQDLLLARLVAFVHDHQRKNYKIWIQGLKELFGVEAIYRVMPTREEVLIAGRRGAGATSPGFYGDG